MVKDKVAEAEWNTHTQPFYGSLEWKYLDVQLGDKTALNMPTPFQLISVTMI